jgi:hypothetical protein
MRKAINSWIEYVNALQSVRRATAALRMREERVAFSTWHEHVCSEGERDAALRRAVSSMLQSSVRASLNTWTSYAEEHAQASRVLAGALSSLQPEGRAMRSAFITWRELFSVLVSIRRSTSSVLQLVERVAFSLWQHYSRFTTHRQSLMHAAIGAMQYNPFKAAWSTWQEYNTFYGTVRCLVLQGLIISNEAQLRKAFLFWASTARSGRAAWLARVMPRWNTGVFVTLKGAGDCLTIHEASNTLIAAGCGGVVPVWSLSDGSMKWTLKHSSNEVRCVATNGTRVATGGLGGKICLHSLRTGMMLKTFQGSSATVHALAMMGDAMVSAGTDRHVRVWSVSGKKDVTLLKEEHTDSVLGVALGSKIIASASVDKSAKLWPFDWRLFPDSKQDWRAPIGGSMKTLQHEAAVYSVSVTDFEVACGCFDGRVYLWSLSTYVRTRTFYHGSAKVCSVRLLCDRLVASGASGKVKVWNTSAKAVDDAEGPFMGTLNHGGAVVGVAISAQGSMASVGLQSGGLRVWRLLPDDDDDGSEDGLKTDPGSAPRSVGPKVNPSPEEPAWLREASAALGSPARSFASIRSSPRATGSSPATGSPRFASSRHSRSVSPAVQSPGTLVSPRTRSVSPSSRRGSESLLFSP